MRGLQREVPEEFADLRCLVNLAGDGLRGVLDGEQRRAEGVDDELDASIGPGKNGEGDEIPR
jgi:hypothetical protein